MIAFYYGLTGFACVWFYRKTFTSSTRNFFMRCVVPLLGGVILLVVFIYGLLQYAKPDWLTDDDGNNVTIFGFGAVAVVGIGAMVSRPGRDGGVLGHRTGLLPGRTLPRRADLLLVPAVNAAPSFGLPDSGDMPTVISPDLSNLPPGEVAIDPLTGEEFTTRT